METLLGKCLGDGGTSTVYEWGKYEVIKIFKSHITEEMITNEEYIGKILNNYSEHIPEIVRRTKIDNKNALIYKKANGKTLAEILLESEAKSDIADKFAKIHYKVHKNTIMKLPFQRDKYNWCIMKLTDTLENYASKMKELLDSLPNDNKLCHEDFHPLNLIVDEEQEKYSVIDWNGACSGNPVLDVAWTFLTLNSPVIVHNFGKNVSDIIVNFSNDYLHSYCRHSNIDKNEILKYLPIVAIRRLYDNITCETEVGSYENDWLKNLIFT